jgi:molybdopterin synthase catalytic subunit
MSSGEDIIGLRSAPLDVGEAVNAAGAGGGGAVALFVGMTRREANASGRQLVSLDYEAYHEMSLEQMRNLAEEARLHWPIGRVVLIHRTGVVKVGEPSVLVAVSTPHRAEAFEACRFLIDKLKQQATIWKKEIWEDGSTSWVDGAAT